MTVCHFTLHILHYTFCCVTNHTTFGDICHHLVNTLCSSTRIRAGNLHEGNTNQHRERRDTEQGSSEQEKDSDQLRQNKELLPKR